MKVLSKAVPTAFKPNIVRTEHPPVAALFQIKALSCNAGVQQAENISSKASRCLMPQTFGTGPTAESTTPTPRCRSSHAVSRARPRHVSLIYGDVLRLYCPRCKRRRRYPCPVNRCRRRSIFVRLAAYAVCLFSGTGGRSGAVVGLFGVGSGLRYCSGFGVAVVAGRHVVKTNLRSGINQLGRGGVVSMLFLVCLELREVICETRRRHLADGISRLPRPVYRRPAASPAGVTWARVCGGNYFLAFPLPGSLPPRYL